MTTFSVAPQVVTDPATGARVQFRVDPNDTALVECVVFAPPQDDEPVQDYLRLVFQRNGLLLRTEMVDAEVEADQVARKQAEQRLALAAPAGVVQTDAEKQAEADVKAKQVEDDKALLASEPKVSKFTVEGPLVGQEPRNRAVVSPVHGVVNTVQPQSGVGVAGLNPVQPQPNVGSNVQPQAPGVFPQPSGTVFPQQPPAPSSQGFSPTPPRPQV